MCRTPAHTCGILRQPHTSCGKLSPACAGAGARVFIRNPESRVSCYPRFQATLDPAHQMNRVRQASMVQRAAPLRRLVTLTPKKLKKAIEITLAAVVACSDRDAAISCPHKTAPLRLGYPKVQPDPNLNLYILG